MTLGSHQRTVMTDWREEKAIVSAALARLLPTLDRPQLTLQVGLRLATLTGIGEKRCRDVLRWLAKEGHPHATHDGGSVLSYGRTVTRWRWHPAPQKESKGSLEGRLNADGVLDTSDW